MKASLALVALASVLPFAVSAEPIDAAFPGVVTVGRAKSSAPSERLDPARRSLSPVLLPAQPVELSRKSVGSLLHSPVVLPDGGIVVALASPEILRLAADGAELTRVRIGSSPALRAPVVLPNGGVAVLTGAPSVVFLSARGKLTATVPLPRASFAVQSAAGGLPDGFASIIATRDGAVAVAAGRSLYEVDASGRVAAKATLPERVSSDPLEHAGALLVMGEAGGVYRIAVPAEPKKLGVLAGASIGSAALFDDRTLIAQAPPNRIVSLDLKSGIAVTRVGDSAFAMFDSPPALAADGTAWLTTMEGFLVGYDSSGAELARVPLDRNALSPGGLLPLRTPGLGTGLQPLARLGVIVDKAGVVAFSRPQGRIGVRDTAGKLVVAVDRGCTTPLSIIPTAPKQMLVSCREGTLIFIGESKDAAP